MNNQMYVYPGHQNMPYDHSYPNNDTRIWGGAFGCGFGMPFFGGFPFFI